MAGALQTFPYEPAGKPRGTVVIAHGLLATSRFFDVRGQEANSYPRWLAAHGFRALTFDHRGMGASHAASESSDFGFAELVEDLRHVVEQVLPGEQRIVLAGHSFGGATVYGLLAAAHAERAPWLPRIRGVITVASPALFQQREGRWRNLFTENALGMMERLRTPGGWLDLVEFTIAQGLLADPKLRAGSLLRRSVAAGLWLGARSAMAARLLLKLPALPTFLYNPGDYTPDQFRDVLGGGVMNRAPVQLLREIIAMGISAQRGGGHLVLRRGDAVLDVTAAMDRLDTPVLAFASETDQLVTRAEAHGLASRPGVQKTLLPPCGHGGYFFKRMTREQLFADSRKFLEAILPPTGS